MTERRKVAKTWVRVGTSVAVVTYGLLHVDRERLWHTLRDVHLPWVGLAIALYVAGQVLSAFKWWLIGRSIALPGSLVEYGRFYFIGMFFNLLGISTVSGDVARGLYLGRGRRPALALNSVVFDRASGLAILMALGSVTLLAYPQYRYGGAFTLVSSAIVAGAVVLVVGWWTAPRLATLLPAENRFRRQIETDLAPLWRNQALLWHVAIVSVALHLSQVSVQWLLGKAVGATLPFAYCLVFHPMLTVVMALPVSVGGFGVREAGYVFFLGLIGTDASTAVAIGLSWWGVTLVAGLVGGALFFTTGAELPRTRVGAREDRDGARMTAPTRARTSR